MTNTILRADNIVKSYTSAERAKAGAASGTQILRGVSLEIQRGEVLAIVGASGAGKSTLLHILSGLDDVDSGTITFAPAPQEQYQYSTSSNDALSALRNKHIGFIFQFHHLLPEFTALENTFIPALIAGESQKRATDKARTLLDRMGLADRLHHKPDALSGGEQQRVAFARSLVNQPSIIFADEPTGNLDSANSNRMMSLIQQFRTEFRQTFVLVTHSPEIAQAADRTLTLREGILV